MNTNWAKILLFTLLGFALGFVVSCLTCGGCMRGGDSCGKEMSCHGERAACGHHGEGEKAACCKGGHGMGGHDAHVQVIVSDLEKNNFQGDTTISIDGGTVNVHRMGDSTTVKVEMMKKEEVVVEHTH